MTEISDMDWAQHIKVDYGQNSRKDQKDPQKFLQGTTFPFHSSTNFI